MKNLFNSFPTEKGDRGDSLNFIKILQYVANVDGIDISEEQGINRLILSRGWDSKIYKEALDDPIKSISDLPYNSDTINIFANYILRDCILVAYIEGGYSDDEKIQISEIAAELGVSQQTLNSIEQAVEHHIKSIELWSPLI